MSHGGAGHCRPVPIIDSSFNPITAKSHARSGHIHQVLGGTVVLLQGTKRPAPVDGPPFVVWTIGKFTAVCFGYGPRANKHAGVSVAMRRDLCSRQHIVTIDYPTDPQLVGRAGFVRIKRGDMDLVVVSSYVHTHLPQG